MMRFKISVEPGEWAVFDIDEDGITQCINDPTVTLTLAQARELASLLKAAITVAELMSKTDAKLPPEVVVR